MIELNSVIIPVREVLVRNPETEWALAIWSWIISQGFARRAEVPVELLEHFKKLNEVR